MEASIITDNARYVTVFVLLVKTPMYVQLVDQDSSYRMEHAKKLATHNTSKIQTTFVKPVILLVVHVLVQPSPNVWAVLMDTSSMDQLVFQDVTTASI